MNKRYKQCKSLPVWLTSKGSVVQHDLPNKVITTTNQLLYSNGVVYIIPRGTVTDNYSIPLGINKSKYDVRPSHLHDIGCYYHKVLVVDLPLYKIDKYIDYKDGIKICMDIPIEYIKIMPVRFNQCNNLLYDGMRASTTIPSYADKLYRFAVNFNINWLFTGKEQLHKDLVYNKLLYTFPYKEKK